MKNYKALIGAILFAGLLSACGVADADTGEVRPSLTFSGGGPDVRGGNHDAVEAMTTTTQAPTTTTMPTTTTTQPPTTTTTEDIEVATGDEFNDPSMDQAMELAESACAAFETSYLHELVDVIHANAASPISTVEAIKLVGFSITASCPEQSDAFIEELQDQYPEYALQVAEEMLEVIG